MWFCSTFELDCSVVKYNTVLTMLLSVKKTEAQKAQKQSRISTEKLIN